jgi:DNA-binding response OmpR family regulator
MTTILVVDDKISVQHLLRDYLQENGFEVVTASDGQQALYAARHHMPDLILLDVMMPEMDGFEFMRQFRGGTPIIVLTARVEETDKIVGLELGADDYVTKPFSMAELVARIRAVLRRTARSANPPEVLRVGDLTLDRTAHTATRGGQPLDLTPTEFDLLALFMSHPGRAFSRADLLEHLQGHAFEGVERTMDVHVRNLRTKIEPEPSQPRYIETVYGVGYRLNRGVG